MDREEYRAAEAVALMEGHQRCPSCRGFPGACCRCRGAIPRADQVPIPDQVEALRFSGYFTREGGHIPDYDHTPCPREHFFCAGCLRAYHADLEVLRQEIRQRSRGWYEVDERVLFSSTQRITGRIGGRR